MIERRELWRDIDNIADTMIEPWLIARDFNNVVSFEDRMGGNAISTYEIVDFKSCINKNYLLEVKFRM